MHKSPRTDECVLLTLALDRSWRVHRHRGVESHAAELAGEVRRIQHLVVQISSQGPQGLPLGRHGICRHATHLSVIGHGHDTNEQRQHARRDSAAKRFEITAARRHTVYAEMSVSGLPRMRLRRLIRPLGVDWAI